MGNEGGPGPGGGDGTEDSTETEQSEPQADERAAEKTSTCATCWQQIPPGQVRCPHCSTPAETCGDDAAPWSYDRVVLGVVPADGARRARAAAATAFARGRTIVSGPDVSHGEVTLRAAFESSLPSDLVEGWPTLPDAVPVASTDGQALFETAAEKAPETTDPVMYCEDGAPVADGDAAETLAEVIDDADVQYWVVPGIVKRYQLPEEPDSFGTPLYCGDCGAVTEHDGIDQRSDGVDHRSGEVDHRTDGVDQRPDAADTPARELWACRVCGAQRYGPE